MTTLLPGEFERSDLQCDGHTIESYERRSTVRGCGFHSVAQDDGQWLVWPSHCSDHLTIDEAVAYRDELNDAIDAGRLLRDRDNPPPASREGLLPAGTTA